MKTVLLAGGRGTRLLDERAVTPKPMVDIGDRPIIRHIMGHYAHFGFSEFIVCLGFMGNVIKRYFLEYPNLASDVTVHTATQKVDVHRPPPEDWTVHLIDTGLNTNTGGRLLRVAPLLSETFFLTYGDGVSDIDLNELLRFHRSHGRIATVSAVHPPARFGGLELDGDRVTTFSEKPQAREGWINGGFMVFEPEVFKDIEDDSTILETDVLERLADRGELMAFRHHSFWQCMDTPRDARVLEKLFEEGPPWFL